MSSSKIARGLLDPAAGDVVFYVRDADNSIRELYAYKTILSAGSEYFECSKLAMRFIFMNYSIKTRMALQKVALGNVQTGKFPANYNRY
jgi:hypothetical protein